MRKRLQAASFGANISKSPVMAKVPAPVRIKSFRSIFNQTISVYAAGGAVDRFALETDASVREVLLACWTLFLSRSSGCADMGVSCEFDGRNHDELKTALGALAKQLPLAAKVEAHESFTDLLCRVRGQMTEIGDWQDCFSCSADQNLVAFFLSLRGVELARAEQRGGVGFRVVEAEAGGAGYTLKLRCERRGGELRLAFHDDASRLSRPVGGTLDGAVDWTLSKWL